LKIVQIITRLIVGGAQENTLITCKLLAERGHDVTLITGPALGPEGELFNQTKEQDYKVVVVDRLRRAINPYNDIVSYFQIKKLLRELRSDSIQRANLDGSNVEELAACWMTGTGGGCSDVALDLANGKL